MTGPVLNAGDSTVLPSSFPFTDHCLAVAKGPALLDEAMGRAEQGHPRRTGPNEEFRQNVIHWRREWQTTPLEPHELCKRTERYDTEA